jgi:hypothetical protein
MLELLEDAHHRQSGPGSFAGIALAAEEPEEMLALQP